MAVHYRLGKLYIINAPWGFSGAFGMVKGFLDPVTVQKIHVLGGGYQTALLDQIPAENLPEEFGGLCKCEAGCQLSDEGPWKEAQYAAPPKASATTTAPPPAASEKEIAAA